VRSQLGSSAPRGAQQTAGAPPEAPGVPASRTPSGSRRRPAANAARALIRRARSAASRQTRSSATLSARATLHAPLVSEAHDGVAGAAAARTSRPGAGIFVAPIWILTRLPKAISAWRRARRGLRSKAELVANTPIPGPIHLVAPASVTHSRLTSCRRRVRTLPPSVLGRLSENSTSASIGSSSRRALATTRERICS
jgi:hypothetical protein